MEPDRWLGVELRHLAALEAIEQEGSFGRAAARLGYTQSAVSQQIATLERIVGERLIERPGGPRPVVLTEAGRLLLGHAEAIVARLRAAQADMAALSEGSAGTLRVGTYQSVGERILPEVMRDFAASWPAVEVRLTESNQDDELVTLVERGELDLTFTALPLPEGPFEAVEILRDPYVLIVPADSPLADRSEAPPMRDIAAMDQIGFHLPCRAVRASEDRLRESGIEPNYVFRSAINGTVQGLVGAGVGVAIVPVLAVDRSDERIAVLELPEMPPRLIAIAWHRDRYRSPAAAAFVETATRVCAELQQPAGAALSAAAR
jgi:molybdate transport repressor ModE-like protein